MELSVTGTALFSALNGLAERQRVTADNIANINTPGYKAKVALFEDALRSSVAAGDGFAATRVTESLSPTKLNGNNVNLDTETLSNIDTVLRFQFAANAMDRQFTGIKTALRTS